MNVLCIFFTLIFAGSASPWTYKRSGDNQEGDGTCTDTNECWNLYNPVYSIIKYPTLEPVPLDNDGHLTLDCGNETLSEAGNCGSEVSVCAGPFTVNQLYDSWELLCQNKEEFEGYHACWNDYDLDLVMYTCPETPSEMAKCVDRLLTSFPGCGPIAGRLFKELVEKAGLPRDH